MTKYNHNLSLTTVLRYVNEHLGASVQEIELSEENIMDVVLQDTLPVFSNYYPFMPIVKLTEKNRIPGTMNEYIIPNPFMLNIVGVDTIINSNSYFNGLSGLYGYIPFTDPIYSQLLADRASATIAPITFDYIPPNKLRIKDNGITTPLDGYIVRIKATQPSHLLGIDYGLREKFCELAYLDVMCALDPIRNRFSEINTAYGTLQYYLDAINTAKDKRKELLDELESSYLMSGQVKKIWIA